MELLAAVLRLAGPALFIITNNKNTFLLKLSNPNLYLGYHHLQ
jgi:hypothetical protein